jgi:inosine-uridine nucleoside N-ribohydrolase
MVDAPDWAVSVETAGTWTRGMTVADRRARPREPLPSGRATVCLEPDAERFFELFLDALS